MADVAVDWTEELTLLKADLSTDLAADLDECVAAANAEDVSELVAASGGKKTKCGLVGTGSTLTVTLDGKLGQGPCSKKGTGAYVGNKVSTPFVGEYTVEVSRISVKITDPAGKVVFKGKGLEKGLTGTWTVKF
ncbi:hypothetical protein MIND_00014700 [Mycena indigotica]|uniref:Uncharacterized protein n=1 Tax=Mycena indigotica TaxID=2126181 RepID=A0A8H6TCN4_9AGAR|nr:uncharacterized protein MIND_00014700 [Mycena indigotica]KAF7315006.1 hypothetical protein MIND_00014700 [Mycena indigotica]